MWLESCVVPTGWAHTSCASMSGVSGPPSPVDSLQSSPAGLQSQMLRGRLLPAPDPRAGQRTWDSGCCERISVALSSSVCTTPWTAAYQAPPSMGFSRQEYWSGVQLPSPLYPIPWSALEKDPRPGPLFEGNPVSLSVVWLWVWWSLSVVWLCWFPGVGSLSLFQQIT